MAEYLIKQGNHYASGLHFGVHFGITEQKYRVKFSKECLYQPLDWENDWNKLCGWSYGMHHKNSIRVGWRPKEDKIELCIYTYENGVRNISDIGQLILEVEEYVDLTLKLFPNNGILMLNNSKSVLSCYSSLDTKSTWGYRLYPFFGGDNPAPHNMKIELERL